MTNNSVVEKNIIMKEAIIALRHLGDKANRKEI
jgi:hypothetical protein